MNIPNIIWRTNAKKKIPITEVLEKLDPIEEEFREMMNYTVTESNNISIETLEDNNWMLSDNIILNNGEIIYGIKQGAVAMEDINTFLEKEEALITGVECGMMSFEVFWKKRKALMGDLK